MRKSLALVALLAMAGLSCGDEPADTEDAAADSADADPNAPDADPNAADADPNAPDASDDRTGIACGVETCTFEAQECCFAGDAQMCVTDGDCQGTTLECDGPEDCPSTGGGGNAAVCCARGGGGDGPGTRCERANECQIQACHDAGDCPQDAAMCCDAGIFPVRVCAAQCNFPNPSP